MQGGQDRQSSQQHTVLDDGPKMNAFCSTTFRDHRGQRQGRFQRCLEETPQPPVGHRAKAVGHQHPGAADPDAQPELTEGDVEMLRKGQLSMCSGSGHIGDAQEVQGAGDELQRLRQQNLQQVLDGQTCHRSDALGGTPPAQRLWKNKDHQGEGQVAQDPHQHCSKGWSNATREEGILQTHDDTLHHRGEEPDVDRGVPL
mmetsp:Transcript_15639/g.26618  ORF Transcript_15639/g.26618 Transcript_15639/m.26618 type:complete len:200 (+) Transcript_15639:135-734(+)